MTHLVIELPSTGIELVSGSVIEKLYNLAISGDLDASSNLLGRLNADGTYLEYIDELEELFDELYITANKIYINFADDEIRTQLMTVYGDGVGICSSDVNTNYLNKSFKNNTRIRTFDELSQFTGVTLLINLQFMGASNLTSIDTSRITHVGDNCITNTKITSLDLSSLTNIGGANAFSGNTLLTSVDFGQNSSLTALGATSFGGCTSLQTITIPTTITTIPDYCFYNDSNLTTISGTSNVTSIGGSAFENCSKLTTIDISSVTALTWSSFKGCSKLNNITLNSGLTSIPSNCFNGCSTLSSIDLSNVTSIGTSAFLGCTALTSVDLSSCTTLSAHAFDGCTSLTNINSDLSLVLTLPYDNVFTNCPITGHIRLTQLTSQSGSPESSFRGTKITSLTLGSVITATLGGVVSGWNTPSSSNLIYLDYSHTNSTKINNSAWAMGNSSLKLIKLPSTITQIGNNIVGNCTSLEAIVLPATTPPTYSGENWQTNTPFLKNGNTLPNANLKIYVPKASLNTYKTDANWGKYSDILLSIEDDYTDPDYYATTNAWQNS